MGATTKYYESQKTNLDHEISFFYACQTGKVQVVKNKIELDGVDPNCRDKVGRTALWYATAARQISTVRYLVENYPMRLHGRTPKTCPLAYAVHYPGYVSCHEIAILLIQHGVPATSNSILLSAIHNDSSEIVSYLLAAGVKCPTKDPPETSSLIRQILKNARIKPQSLAQIARIAIRNLINESTTGISLVRAIDQLPLPSQIKDYVKLSYL